MPATSAALPLLRCRSHSRHTSSRSSENYDSPNVIGKVTGTAPGHAVLYTAHYDHFGVDRTRTGDPVFHGAADNGTGTAIVMELARAFGSKRAVPPSTVILAAVTAEEQGLLGSEYLGTHTPVPPRDISLDLNYDELLPIGDVSSVRAGGLERTTVAPLFDALAKKDGLTPREERRRRWRRLLSLGSLLARPRWHSRVFPSARAHSSSGMMKPGRARSRRTSMRNKYHTPADIYSDTMDFAGNARIARFGFELGWLVMAQPARVEWLPGDEFEAARKKAAAAR